jgi:tripartite-type tricarboxylate transporter receptor subunit TctC
VPDIAFIVPFGRDGAADRAARDFASSLRAPQRGDRPGPDLLLETLPGSGGLLGVQRANALAREGAPVLLLATPSTHILLPARIGASAVVDPAFRPVRDLPSGPNVLLASPRLGVRTVAELVERARTERLTYASAGTGQTIHVCSALFCALAHVPMHHRPYAEGSAAPHEDLVAGRVHVYFDNLLGCRERVARGEAVALAVSDVERDPRLPNVPTLVECGFPEHALDVWLAVFGANLDAAALERLAADAASVARLEQRVERSRAQWTRALATISA